MIMAGHKNQIDKIWDDMYSYGIANPLVVIEQLTYLFFIRSLDEIETHNERVDAELSLSGGERIFPQTEEGQLLRFGKFSTLEAQKMFDIIRDKVFPFIKRLQTGKKSAYAKYMKDANFILPNALITEKVVTAIKELPLKENDLKGDLYEYMISKLQTAGRIGQFRTPRHIINMMVNIIKPTLRDTVADPACGTGGFLVMAGHYVREQNQEELRRNKAAQEHYSGRMFTGYDTDQTMLRITAMNAILHNMDNANIRFNDSLSKDNGDTDKFTVVLANPPFKGSLDHNSVAPSLLSVTDTKKTELLFLALFLRMLDAGGRCACIVPDGVLFGTSAAHKAIRKELVEKHKLQAVISMPSGVFKPYAGVSTAVLVFTKTGTGGTDNVWFYDMKADGLSLDDKRTETRENDIPDIVARWDNLTAETTRKRTEQSFLVSKDEIVGNGYDLSINKYKKSDYVPVQYAAPKVILAEIQALEQEISDGLRELEGLLNG
jgi:type I restriction enzyme M protein